MNVSSIIKNSIKYPLKNLVRLPILFILFILITIIPIGRILNNNYLVLLGGVSFFIFILIVPGYFLSIVKTGSRESKIFPSFDLVNNIHDSIRVLILRAVYMIVPAIVIFIALYFGSSASFTQLQAFQIPDFLATVGLMIVAILVTYLVFEFLLFFAKARLAYFNSLSDAIKISNVIRDIRNIGIGNIIKWLIFMVILMIVVSVVSSFVLTIPYVGFLIDLCIVLPTIESIGNYSLGLLYSNIAKNDNLNRFEREIQMSKYNN